MKAAPAFAISALALVLIFAVIFRPSFGEPIRCNEYGERVWSRTDMSSRASDAIRANNELQERRQLVTSGDPRGQWLTEDSLKKADGCP